MAKTLGLNKHQKAAKRVKERRLDPAEIPALVEMSRSDDAEDRLVAAENLCPCHVRKRIESVWEALYRMLEDGDVRVRRAAWHTLEDGGRPDDPALDAIMERVLKTETDSRVRNFIQQIGGGKREKDRILDRALARPPVKRHGRCDFCGEFDVPVTQDLETMIPTDDLPRAALVCDACTRDA